MVKAFHKRSTTISTWMDSWCTVYTSSQTSLMYCVSMRINPLQLSTHRMSQIPSWLTRAVENFECYASNWCNKPERLGCHPNQLIETHPKCYWNLECKFNREISIRIIYILCIIKVYEKWRPANLVLALQSLIEQTGMHTVHNHFGKWCVLQTFPFPVELWCSRRFGCWKISIFIYLYSLPTLIGRSMVMAYEK